jgi:flagellar basal body-associated protein FliL
MSDSSNVMIIILVVLVLANLAVSIYVAMKVRSAEDEEDYQQSAKSAKILADQKAAQANQLAQQRAAELAAYMKVPASKSSGRR